MPDMLEWQAAVSLDFFLKDFFYDLSTCGQTLLKGGGGGGEGRKVKLKLFGILYTLAQKLNLNIL